MSESVKKAKITQILPVLWRNFPIKEDKLYNWIATTNNFLACLEHKIMVVFDPFFDGAYTTITNAEKNLRIIKIGGRLVQEIVGLKDEVTKKEVYDNAKNILFSMVGLNYHEMGHNLYTDMASRDIIDYKEPKYINFMHTVFNTVEDFCVEKYIAALVAEEYPDYIQPRRCFKYMVAQLFTKQGKEYEDDGTAKSFLQYLLLLVRVGKKNIGSTNTVFEKYQEELVPRYSECLAETDPTTRLKKVIAFCEWMIENIKELDFATVEPPKVKISGKIPGKPIGKPIVTKKKGDKPTDISKDILGDKPEGEDDKEEEEKESEDAMIDPESVDLDADFDEAIATAADHVNIYAKDEFLIKNATVWDDINNIIANMEGTVCEVENIIKLFEARKAPRDVIGFTKGRFDTRTAIQNSMRGGCNLKVFSRPIPRGKKRSLAVCCVGDNSGSMGGIKSEICSTAMLTLAEVCEATKTPSKFCCFTKDYDGHLGGNVTIIEKDFTDSFEESKPYFAINSSSLIRKLESINNVPTFSGNSEEINIHYIGQEFKKRPEEIKLMFVICDGATTGSRSLLSKNIKELESEGIIVIGIGVKTDIGSLYSQSKMFSSTEDLKENLGNYLIEKLSEYALR